MNNLNLLEKTKQLYEINQSIIDISVVTAKNYKKRKTASDTFK